MLQQGMCPLPKDPGVIGYCLILILPGTTDAQPHSFVPRWLSVGLSQLKPAACTGLWGDWDYGTWRAPFPSKWDKVFLPGLKSRRFCSNGKFSFGPEPLVIR